MKISKVGFLALAIFVGVVSWRKIAAQPAKPREILDSDYHGVPAGTPYSYGSLEIVTGVPSLEHNPSVPGNRAGGGTVNNLWLKSGSGTFRYYSDDHSTILFEGKYTTLEIRDATITKFQDGKQQFYALPTGLTTSSLALKSMVPVQQIMGGTVSVPTPNLAVVNPDEIRIVSDAKSIVVEQKGTLQMSTYNQVVLASAQLSAPACSVEASRKFTSAGNSKTVFHLALSKTEAILDEAKLTSPAESNASVSRLNCGSLHVALSKFNTAILVATIDSKSVSLATTVNGSGGFLATVGDQLPVAGKGAFSAAILKGVAPRSLDKAELSDFSVSGLNFQSGTNLTAASIRSFTAELADLLGLPDFLSPDQQQAKAIKDTASAMDGLEANGSDVLVHIPASEVNSLVAEKLKSLGFQQAISFGFGRQEILTFIPASSASLGPGLVVHLALALNDSDLSIRPSIDFAALSKLSGAQVGAGFITPTKISAYIAGQLVGVTKPLSSLQAEVKVPVPTSETVPVDLSSTSTDQATGATIAVSSKLSSITVSVPNKALLIDPDGLHLLAKVTIQ